VHRYVGEWIAGIDDITATCVEIHDLVKAGDLVAAVKRFPPNDPIPVRRTIRPAGLSRTKALPPPASAVRQSAA
jgi:hypothetical protein